MIPESEIQEILKIAVRGPAPWHDRFLNVEPPKPGKKLLPEDFQQMSEDEKRLLLAELQKVIEERFKGVDVSDEKVQRYYKEIMDYLSGGSPARPDPPKPVDPTETDTVQLDRSQMRRSLPRNWYEKAKESIAT